MSQTDSVMKLAAGMQWLLDYIGGEPISQIARRTNHHRDTITHHMKRAAGLMLEAAQEEVFRELFPLAKASVAAQLQQEIADVKAGVAPKTNWTERILKGMYVLDAPQLKAQAAQPEEGEESLSMVLRRKTRAKLNPESTLKAIEGETIPDGGYNQTD